MEARAIVLEVAYDGRPYAGFAAQPGQRTVAGELLQAIQAIDASVDRLKVASRTDAGVHARTQVVAFDTVANLPSRGWVLAVGQAVPDSIAVLRAGYAPRGYNPRFDTIGKRYRYLLWCSRLRDPFLAGRAWQVFGLDASAALPALADELALARGTHDFAAFSSARDVRQHTERTMFATAVMPGAQPGLLVLEVRGNGFLHNMVRILVGTAVDVARGQLAAGAIARALASLDRRDAGMTAPPDGLYLEELELRTRATEAWPPYPSS